MYWSQGGPGGEVGGGGRGGGPPGPTGLETRAPAPVAPP